MQRHGKILNRTLRDGNEIICRGNKGFIVLRDRKQKVVGRAIIDRSLVARVKNIKWSLGNCGYAITGHLRNGSRLLHRFLFGKKGYEIDHINRNRLDNRKVNIRHCSRSQNMFNKTKQNNNSTGVLGVYFDKSRGKYAAEIKAYGVKKFLGRFNTLKEAKEKRIAAEREYFGKWKYQ